MSIANISSSAIDKLLSTTSEEPPVGSKGAALFAKFSELLTTGAGADHGGNPEQEKLTAGKASSALKSGDEIDIVAFLGFVAALEDQMSKTPGDGGLHASVPERSGEKIGLEDLAPPFIADPDFVITRDKLAQAISALADDPQAVAFPRLNGLRPYLEAFHRHSSIGVNKEPETANTLPVAEGAFSLDYVEIMVRTQHVAYPSEAVAHQPMPHKPLLGPLEKVDSSKRESAPLEPILEQSGRAALVSDDAQLFESISGKSAKPELGSGALAVAGLKGNGEQGIATQAPGTPVKGFEADEVAPKSIAAQTADVQTDTKPHARAMHQIPHVEPEKAFALRQSATDGPSSADLSKNNAPRLPSTLSSLPVDPAADLETAPKPDSGKLQVPEGQQKEALKPTNLLKPETALKPEQIALRAASASASAPAPAASGNDPAASSKIKVALEASALAGATPIQKTVEAEFKPKPEVKGPAVKSQKTFEQGKAAPVTGAAAAALRQAAVAANASEGGADAAKDLGALPHSISPLSSANLQLAQTQTAPQTSGQLLDKWVDSHLDLNARGWTQTLARNVISALRTGQQQIALTLSPASLGKMHIAFGRNESGLDVKIQAERKATVSLFGESEGKIISSLETAGYRVTSLSCSVMQTSDENFNMNLGQGFNEQENPSGDERSQTAQKNEQHAGKAADDGSLKGKGDQDGLVDITI